MLSLSSAKPVLNAPKPALFMHNEPLFDLLKALHAHFPPIRAL